MVEHRDKRIIHEEVSGDKKPAELVVADIYSERLESKSGNQMVNSNDIHFMQFAERIFQESDISPENRTAILEKFQQLREKGYGRDEEIVHANLDRMLQILTPTE